MKLRLSDQQVAFAELLRDKQALSAKDAAILVGCNPKTAASLASRWRRYPEVAAIIAGTTKGAHPALPNQCKPKSTANLQLKKTDVQARETAPHPSPVMDAEPLNPRHQRFCMEYLADENGTQAYLRCYPNSSYDAAAVSAYELLRNPKILQRIEELREERNRSLGITSGRVLAIIACQAFYDPRKLFDSDGRLKPFDELDPDTATAIAGFTTKATVTGEEKDGICFVTNVKLPDRLRAAELLGRHLKLFTDKIELTEDSDFARRLGEAVKAAKEARGGGKGN